MRYRMIQRAAWIRSLRDYLGLNQTEFAVRLDVSQPTASRWEKDMEPKVPHWERLKALAEQSGYPLPNSAVSPTVQVIGYVGAGAELNLFGTGQGPFDEVEMPPNGTIETVAVVVRGNSMAGLADDNWIIYYDDVHTPPHDGLIGKTCVIGLVDDRVVVKKLMPGRQAGKFDLYSSNATPMLDQEVLWAAPVTWIKPR